MTCHRQLRAGGQQQQAARQPAERPGGRRRDANTELERILLGADRDVRDLARERGVPMRRAAYRIAVDRVAEAIRLRRFV